MKRILLLTLFSLAALLHAADDATEVKQSSTTWRDAVIKQDKDALARFLADDLVYAHSGGKTETKAEYIAAVTSGPPRYESFTESNTSVRVYGKAAVLEGNVQVKQIGRAPYKVRTLEVYVKNGNAWKMTAHQSTRLNP